MKSNLFLYLLTVTALFFISACGDSSRSDGDIQNTINKKKSIEQLENPLNGYYAGTIYDDKISLDITDYREKEAREHGAELISGQALLHVKITEDLQIIDTEGNILSFEQLDIGNKIYLEVEGLENQEVTIETNLLIVEK